MGLRNFHPATKTVKGVKVRGVSLNDMAILTEAYGPAMVKLFKLATEQSGVSQSAISLVVGTAAREFPDFLGKFLNLLIVLDPGEEPTPDEEAAVKINQMNIGMQIELIEGIFTCTFETDADVKKMVEAITRMLDKITTAVEQVPQLHTETINSGSDAK